MIVLNYLGKALISIGLGVLMFVAWTLWGTGLYTQREQDRLERVFAGLPPLAAPAGRAGDRIEVPEDFAPDPGDPVFKLRIPSIELDQTVVEGVGTYELRKGPGHYPECGPGFARPFCTELPAVWPGERGRVIVSGHRTTYGAPFWDMDRLRNGDEVFVQTKWGRFTYVVTGKEVVPADSRDIANPAATTAAEIVFTTCHPKFSAAERLVVYAEMQRTF